MPSGFSHDYLADPVNMCRRATSLVAFGFAIIIIFLVLAAQFKACAIRW